MGFDVGEGIGEEVANLVRLTTVATFLDRWNDVPVIAKAAQSLLARPKCGLDVMEGALRSLSAPHFELISAAVLAKGRLLSMTPDFLRWPWTLERPQF